MKKHKSWTWNFPIQEPHRGWLGSVVHVTCWHPLGEPKSHTPSGSMSSCVCLRLMKSSGWWGKGADHTPQGEQTGKQVLRCFTRSITPTTYLLMISTTSSTAEMVTQGKLQINAVDNVEGKYFLGSFKKMSLTLWLSLDGNYLFFNNLLTRDTEWVGKVWIIQGEYVRNKYCFRGPKWTVFKGPGTSRSAPVNQKISPHYNALHNAIQCIV